VVPQKILGENKMGALSLRLPASIHRHIRELAEKEGVSINQFISSAVSEKISALMTEDYLAQRAKRAQRADFKKVLAKVPNRKPVKGDELDRS
jgi:hypothetical protein